MNMEGVQGSVAANSTVYIRNLPERVKIDDLKENLKVIFEEYGNILDIIAKRSLKRRGQAFVVFDNVASATKAIDELQGLEMGGKEMRMSYARTKSDATVKREGTEQDFEQHKRRRLAEKERKQAQEEAEKKARATGAPEPAKPRAPKTGMQAVPDEFVPANKILFVQNIPKDVDTEALTTLFQQFPGFKEVRTVPGRVGIAFVEYEHEDFAIKAKETTANMRLGADQKPIKVTYQRQG
ncbi:small nuclear ribonucleoprotein U1a [Delitschia confertaspora ATCC 74209]|uniref:Small nuclear ribonucleoprotein U1a n=1 Tax=Delitschia confertaspora ATCC 74209 TaxID=1513339 RepID=A0A9P4JI39_9PLEO|nr:small nuclear ribonucleoprotein U1a [Delitschia confertaspora ATCC 74209]